MKPMSRSIQLYACNGVLVRAKIEKYATSYEVLVLKRKTGRYYLDEVCHARSVFEATVPYSDDARADYEVTTSKLREPHPDTGRDGADRADVVRRRDEWLFAHGEAPEQVRDGEWAAVAPDDFDPAIWADSAPRWAMAGTTVTIVPLDA